VQNVSQLNGLKFFVPPKQKPAPLKGSTKLGSVDKSVYRKCCQSVFKSNGVNHKNGNKKPGCKNA